MTKISSYNNHPQKTFNFNTIECHIFLTTIMNTIFTVNLEFFNKPKNHTWKASQSIQLHILLKLNQHTTGFSLFLCELNRQLNSKELMAIGFHASLITQLKHGYRPFSHNIYFRQLYLSTTNNQITGVHKKTPNFQSSLTARTPKKLQSQELRITTSTVKL